jgi:hypothetical protein
MAFYPQSDEKNLGLIFRQGLDDLRSALHKLAYCKAVADQQSDAQFGIEFGYVADDAAARAEMRADIGRLVDGDAGTSCETMTAGVDQMIAQFG